MSLDEDYGSDWSFRIICIGLIIGIGAVTVLMVTAPPRAEPIVTTKTEYFNGKLGMVSYQNSWFGLGGPDKTTTTFQNDSTLVDFTFDKYLGVEVGKFYTVEYEVTIVVYYNVTKIEKPNVWNLMFDAYYNSTSIAPINIIETSVDTK